MPQPIEDYALIGDGHTVALVGRDGSIDWLCVPRFDAPACFAALLGSPAHGRWQIAPETTVQRVQRRYRAQTLILETDFETDGGIVRLIDCMPLANDRRDIVRSVECLRGEVALRMELVIRFDTSRPGATRNASQIVCRSMWRLATGAMCRPEGDGVQRGIAISPLVGHPRTCHRHAGSSRSPSLARRCHWQL